MSSLTIEKILEAIRYIITQNGYELTEKQIDKANKEIIPYLYETLTISDKDYNVHYIGRPVLSKDRKIYPAVMKYFSITQENSGLYNDLLEDGYRFIEPHTNFKFYSLDRNFTNHFKKNEFKKLILKNDEVFRTFYYSLRGLDSKEKELYYTEFERIIRKDASTMKVGQNTRGGYNSFNYLTYRNIKYFGGDYLTSIGTNERNVINNLHCRLDDEIVSYIKSLLEKYPDFKAMIPIDSKVIKNFTIDELNNMSYKDSKLYEHALKNNLVSRVKELLKMDEDFNAPENFIREEVFKVLSNEEILNLSMDAIEKISKIKFKQIDNVIVMPVKEIYKIVSHDKLHRKIENITGRRR